MYEQKPGCCERGKCLSSLLLQQSARLLTSQNKLHCFKLIPCWISHPLNEDVGVSFPRHTHFNLVAPDFTLLVIFREKATRCHLSAQWWCSAVNTSSCCCHWQLTPRGCHQWVPRNMRIFHFFKNRIFCMRSTSLLLTVWKWCSCQCRWWWWKINNNWPNYPCLEASLSSACCFGSTTCSFRILTDPRSKTLAATSLWNGS